MNAMFTEIHQTVVPGTETRDGPLPPLLLLMTFVTGLVDAFSYLVLGHVFVANMTGNVVFLGFALAGAPGFSIGASVVALASFVLGALVGGRVGSHFAQHRGRLLNTAASIQGVLLAAALVLAALSTSPVTGAFRYPLIVVLGIAMGTQNAAARRLAVPDFTTTNVLTTTITGAAADSVIAGGTGSRAGRRITAVAAMLVGAVIGAAFIVHVHLVYPLALALIVIAAVVAATRPLRRSDLPWVRA